jgi:hypothetical protein
MILQQASFGLRRPCVGLRGSARSHRLCALLWLLCAGCSKEAPAGSPPLAREPESRAQKKPRVTITVIATAGEGRALLPAADGSGGAARALGYWQAREAHCSSGPECGTLLLSAGGGAEDELLGSVMKQMGYAASIVGRPALARAGIARVGLASDPALRVERQGIKFDVIGMAKQRADGTLDDDPLAAVRAKVLSIRDRGADVGILLSDACTSELASLLRQAARDWAFLVLAIGRTCGSSERESHIHNATLLGAGDGFGDYVRAKLTFDRNTGALLRAETGTIPVSGAQDAPAPDAALSARLAAAQPAH